MTRYETDYGPVVIGPSEEDVFRNAHWAREMRATPGNWLMETEAMLICHLNAIGKKLHGRD